MKPALGICLWKLQATVQGLQGFGDVVVHEINGFVHGLELLHALVAGGNFDGAVLEALGADDHADRHAEQVGIGVGRLAASVCEAHRDDYGPIWPISIAPWHVHLCSMRADNEEVKAMSQKIYDDLTARGVEVIWDDREVSAGVMFADADLFGVPVRMIVSPKGLKNGTIEISARDKSMKEIKPVDEAVDFVYNYVVDELAKLDCRL